MLPASKDDFPKCLYLDQNKWIGLATAHYGKPGGEAFAEALSAVHSAVESGRLIVPFSVLNAVETMIRRDEASRERLARFMVALSGNHTIVPEQTACLWEIGNAVKRLFGKGSQTVVRTLVVQQQYCSAHRLQCRR